MNRSTGKSARKITHKRADCYNSCFGLLDGIGDANTRIVRGIQYLECVDICRDHARMNALTQPHTAAGFGCIQHPQHTRRRREAPVCLQSPKTGMIEWLDEIATASYH